MVVAGRMDQGCLLIKVQRPTWIRAGTVDAVANIIVWEATVRRPRRWQLRVANDGSNGNIVIIHR